LERATFRTYLKNKIAKWAKLDPDGRENATLAIVLKWVQGRHKRYDKKPGGLGK
jgi:hypothetical protein